MKKETEMRVSKAMAAIGMGACALVAATGAAEALNVGGVDSVPPKETGKAVPVMLARGLAKVIVAQGSDSLDGGTAANPYYGYDGDGPMVPAPGDTPTPTHQVEATKTEPDKNTYLVLQGERGPTAGFDYGTHFVFQGHEGGDPGFLSRINLDADGAHRVTLMASHDVHGNPLPEYDGSTWDPFAHRLILTTEDGTIAGAYEATANYPSRVSDLEKVLGDAAYEGVQVDSRGDLWLVEDSGGAFGTVNDKAKQPNSFVYRFIPTNPRSLDAGGTLQALQVISTISGDPIVFHDGQADADIYLARRARAAHLRQHVPRPLGDAAQHAVGRLRGLRRQRAREAGRGYAVQAARERRVRAGDRVREVRLHGDGRHRCRQPGRGRPGRVRRAVRGEPGRPAGGEGPPADGHSRR
jgi:hypothetical protein